MIADTLILTLPKVSLQAKTLLPEYSGVYYVLDEANNIWYIGKANNIQKRWQGKSHHRIYQLEAQKKKHFTIYYEQISFSQLDIVEKQRIKQYEPALNFSPVKPKKVRSVETLLRETLATIADFAFLLGVEPPRKEIAAQINIKWLIEKDVLELSTVHVCLDIKLLKQKFNIQSVNEQEALLKTAFGSRKSYCKKWKPLIPDHPYLYRLCFNGYALDIHTWEAWYSKEESQEIREYTQTTLAQEPIRALSAESLYRLQQESENKNILLLNILKRLKPYISDLIYPTLNEPVDRESAKEQLEKISLGYKSGIRGIGSRSSQNPVKLVNSKFSSLDDLLLYRGINFYKNSRDRSINYPYNEERMDLYLKPFNIGLETKNRLGKSSKQLAEGIINNEIKRALCYHFKTVYILASVNKKDWLLVEEYFKDFSIPASTPLSNGEGLVAKFYVSARKCIAPAKVNIKIDSIGYSAWIPFGLNDNFSTFEAATAEIRQRLQSSELTGLKIAFKRESLEKAVDCNFFNSIGPRQNTSPTDIAPP